MFRKTSEQKVLRDPVHGYIHVDYEVVWDCINSRWFQRLRRIRQLGGAYTVYHTADHTRFAHSLGVYEIVRRMVTEVPDLCVALDEKEKVTVMLAALLHDIGHGPYSHAFEAISRISHEFYTVKIIEEDPEISGILNRCEEGLAKDVADVLRNQYKNPLLSQLISAQLDADRMDYLLRDAYFTGTAYGEFDLERILRTMRVSQGYIVVKESGVYAVENY
ncbi:MAG: HD domain-containing protein, partial [Solobacterium sp.]|nr:HD domain-containing protein [Solobacterium sp.]